MHARCCQWPATSGVHYTTSCNTQSSAPEDVWAQHLKHVQMIGIINKLLLLHLLRVYIIYINDLRSKNIKFNKNVFVKFEIFELYTAVVLKFKFLCHFTTFLSSAQNNLNVNKTSFCLFYFTRVTND